MELLDVTHKTKLGHHPHTLLSNAMRVMSWLYHWENNYPEKGKIQISATKDKLKGQVYFFSFLGRKSIKRTLEMERDNVRLGTGLPGISK